MKKHTQEELMKLNKADLTALILEQQEALNSNPDERVAKLEALLSAKNAEFEKQSKELEDLGDVVLQLNQKLTVAEKSVKADEKVLKIGDRNFKMKFPKVNFENTTITFDVLKNDPKLAEKCVEQEVAFLIEVQS